MAIGKHIVITILILTTCNHLRSQRKRKFKAAEEVKSKRPDKNVDDSRPDMKGKIGCNACCLYWALHGVSHFLPHKLCGITVKKSFQTDAFIDFIASV